MEKMLFTAMNGAKQAMQAQASISHNLANVSTVGFKASLDTFTSWHVDGSGFNSRVYNQLQELGSDLSKGSLTATSRELDIAVSGEGWIAVQGRDGSEAYTRAGDLRLDENGQLTTGVGHPVIGNSGPIIIPPSSKIDIGKDASISIIPVGQSADTLAIVDRIKVVKPDEALLHKGSDGLMRLNGGAIAEPDATVNLVSGFVEHSNVNAISALVDLIQNSRQFEVNVKLMKAAQTNDESSARLLRES